MRLGNFKFMLGDLAIDTIWYDNGDFIGEKSRWIGQTISLSKESFGILFTLANENILSPQKLRDLANAIESFEAQNKHNWIKKD